MTASESTHSPAESAKRPRFLAHYGPTVMGQGLVLGLGILTGILSARILGPVGRGEYVAVCAWPMGISTLISLGISQALTFNVGRRTFSISEMTTAALTLAVIQGALTIAVGFVILPRVLDKYSPTVQHLGIVFLLLTPAVVLGMYASNVFQGVQDLSRFNIIRVLPPFVYLAGLFAIHFAHLKSLQGVIFSQLAGYAITVVVGSWLIRKCFRPRWQWNKSAIPSLVSFGFRTHATSLANYFNQRIDQLILSVIIPPRELGFYAVAVTLSTSVTVFSVAAGIVTFSHGSSQQSDDAKATIGRSFRAALIMLLVACSALYAVAPFLIRRIFGPAFEGSIVACRILLPGALMIGLNQVLYNGSSALGWPGLPSCAEGLSMAITAVGLYVLVPRYGYIGAAIVSSIAYTVSFLVMLVLGQRFLGLPVRTLILGGSRITRNEC
jgi:O-antigen/teichoic acid export membrane protein